MTLSNILIHVIALAIGIAAVLIFCSVFRGDN